MSEQGIYQAAQNTPLSLTEIVSAVEIGNGFYETLNKVKFTHVEFIGIVSRVMAGEDNVAMKVDATMESGSSLSTVYVGAKFADELKSVISSLLEHSLVLVRGKLSVYTKDGETRMSVNPRQVIEIDATRGDTEMRDYWYHAMLLTRVANRYPIIKGGELYSIVNDLGIETVPYDGDDRLVIVSTVTIASSNVNVPPRQAATRTSVGSLPARSPELPSELQRRVSTSTAEDGNVTTEQVVALISEQTGIDHDEIIKNVSDVMEDLAGLVSETGAAFSVAQSFNVDTSVLKGGALASNKSVMIGSGKSLPASVPTMTKPAPVKTTKPAVKLATRPKTIPAPVQDSKVKGIVTDDDVLGIVKELATNGVSTSIVDVYSRVKVKFGIDDNTTQDIILKLYSNNKIDLDGDMVTLL